MSIHVRQLKLLDDEGISVFNSADIEDETLRATSSFILFHIVSSLANMFSSLVCFVGLQRDIRLTLLPFIFTLSNFMTLRHLEFQEHIMIGAFLIKIIQFEKIRSIGNIFISLANLNIKFHFRN